MGSTLPVPFWLDNQYYEQLPSILVEPPLEINSPGTFVNEEKEPEIITSEKNSFVDKISSPPHTIGEASCLQTIEPARGLNVEISGSTTELQRFDYQDKPIECYELVDEHFQEVATEQAVVHALCMFKADDTPLIVEPAQILASSAAINDEDDAHVVMDKPSQIENSTPTESLPKAKRELISSTSLKKILTHYHSTSCLKGCCFFNPLRSMAMQKLKALAENNAMITKELIEKTLQKD